MEDSLRVAVVLGLVAANAFFVVGEYAALTARRASLTPLAEAGSKRAAAVLRLMDDPVRVISTVQVGITAVGILIGAIGEPLVSDLLGGGLPEWLNFLIAFGFVTYLSVVLGELVPKAASDWTRSGQRCGKRSPSLTRLSSIYSPSPTRLKTSDWAPMGTRATNGRCLQVLQLPFVADGR